MHTSTTGTAAAEDAASATAPPAPSIIAPANWAVPSRADLSRRARRLDADYDRSPSTADNTAAHTHSMPAINMGPQYDPAP